MGFNEANAARDAIRDHLVPEWEFISRPDLNRVRRETDVLVEQHLVEALIRLNPEIAR